MPRMISRSPTRRSFRVAPPRAMSGPSAARGLGLVLLLGVSLAIGYVVSFASTLWTEYHYAWTRDVSAKMPINDWGALDNPRNQILDTSLGYEKGIYNFKHSPAGYFTFGFFFTALLSVLRLRYPWWPLHPVGFLMMGDVSRGAPVVQHFSGGGWPSGLILRFGGAGMYVNAKPVFLGLIVGESMAAGFWLVMGDPPQQPRHPLPAGEYHAGMTGPIRSDFAIGRSPWRGRLDRRWRWRRRTNRRLHRAPARSSSALIPPSISRRWCLPRRLRSSRSLGNASGMNFWPEKPGDDAHHEHHVHVLECGIQFFPPAWPG